MNNTTSLIHNLKIQDPNSSPLHPEKNIRFIGIDDQSLPTGTQTGCITSQSQNIIFNTWMDGSTHYNKNPLSNIQLIKVNLACRILDEFLPSIHLKTQQRKLL